uniref:Uncharacterized protein n=1 Tax=Rhizophora mucronata TaxID=61149 RepID=A0A2P2PPF4_RHIMU
MHERPDFKASLYIQKVNTPM